MAAELWEEEVALLFTGDKVTLGIYLTTMDTRATIPPGGSFYPVIMELYEKKQIAAILYDDNGVTRANGLIESIFERDGKRWFRLEDQTEIRIDKLYAVNGLFSSDYSEC